ncbi:MAG TPA: fumarylacetoacetate hydrolase family protein [Vicinamibacterales bacterium]|nr:fumarylacetoacetate hydrolase family protein [Vicinamibacterales bacterium]
MPHFRLFRTPDGWFLDSTAGAVRVAEEGDGLTARDDLPEWLSDLRVPGSEFQVPGPDFQVRSPGLLAPLERQEVWAAGVTYLRSRTARMEEARVPAGARFYDLVYEADRPELFFKAAAWRVKGPGEQVRIRRDASWNVPEPEIALLVSPSGRILGYTAGNDMSSRDIEGENPLYLPQAKVYDGSCALGPAIVVGGPPAPSVTIQLEIRRGPRAEFSASTTVAQMKRDFGTLVEFLYRETSFPEGCLLLTGTGIVPPDSFTLRSGDDVLITVDGVGTLRNGVG